MKRALIICLVVLLMAMPAGTARAATWPDAYNTESDTADNWNQFLASIGDVDDDGIRDIIAGCEGDVEVDLPALVVISGGYGTKIWDSMDGGSSNPEAVVLSVAAIDSVSDDEIPDVLAGSADGFVYCYDGTDGALLWEFNTETPVISVAAIEDVNDDEIPDVLAGLDAGVVLCLDGDPDATTRVLWGLGTSGAVFSVAVIDDVNESGIQDVIAGDDGGYIYCIEGGSPEEAEPLWEFATEDCIYSVAAIDDVNDDGIQDVLAGLEAGVVLCFDGDPAVAEGDRVLWDLETDGVVFSVAVIDDVNESGKQDVIAGDEGGNIYCIEGDSPEEAELLWEFATEGAPVPSVAAIDDVNGDGIQDVLAGSVDNYIYCIEGDARLDGDVVEDVLWEYDTSHWVMCVASLGQDMDGDGYHEAIAINVSGYVYCFSGNAGSPVPPIPELPTIILLGTGLAALGGYFVLRKLQRARKGNALPS